MLIGVSLNLKDKRVEKMLRKKGIENAEIYYSPIQTWVILCLLLLPSGFWLILLWAQSNWGLLILPYFLISYLLNAHHNTSFALKDNQLMAINPNFPFRYVKAFSLHDIERVTIDSGKRKWLPLFLLFGENYLRIQTKNKNFKYSCSGLELDGFDENWTEKTIEDLDFKLKGKGVVTDFRLKCD